MTIEGFAPAKINLTLHVTARRSDGYHLLDSLVVFADLGDRLWFDPRDDMSMEITGPFAAGVPHDARNLVWRAATAAQVSGHITLEKNLPHGAGLGGGSADAAALLRSLSGPRMEAGIGPEATLALGADVPVCMNPMPQQMAGIGDVIGPARAVPALDIVLVNPRIAVPTAQVFSRLQSTQNPGMAMRTGSDNLAGFLEWLHGQRNDMQSAAILLAPEIGSVLEALGGAVLTRMSGSGSTCFGIYPNAAAAQHAAKQISRQYPDWWVMPARTGGCRAA